MATIGGGVVKRVVVRGWVPVCGMAGTMAWEMGRGRVLDGPRHFLPVKFPEGWIMTVPSRGLMQFAQMEHGGIAA